MARRDLNLNSLGRYAKDSDHLILEEHSHCEVPAGCGGVVLRWRNPSAGLPLLCRLFAQGECKLFIDGTAPSSSRPLISFGSHVVSLIFSKVDPIEAAIAFSAVHDDSQPGFPRVSRPSGQRINILSAGDGSWKYSATEPVSDAWMSPAFDDSQWPAMAACDPPTLDKKDMQHFRLHAVLRVGANCLRIDAPTSRLWIRRAFTISASA